MQCYLKNYNLFLKKPVTEGWRTVAVQIAFLWWWADHYEVIKWECLPGCVHICVTVCVCCARLFFHWFMLNKQHSGCNTKTQSTSWPACVCAAASPLFLHNPSCQTEVRHPKPFLLMLPHSSLPQEVTHLTRSQPLGSARLRKVMWTCLCRPSKIGWAADSIGMMVVIFRPCILSLCSGRPTNEVTHQLIDVSVSLWASVFVMSSSRHRNRFPLSLQLLFLFSGRMSSRCGEGWQRLFCYLTIVWTWCVSESKGWGVFETDTVFRRTQENWLDIYNN